MSNVSVSSLASVYDQLTNFAKLENFWSLFDTAFGSSYDFAIAASLRSQWQGGNFSQFPQIEVVNSDVLGSAEGAYAISTNRIYLLNQFLSAASQQSLVTVILEEFGHFVDAQVNATDTPGDEGELFSDLVRGVNLSAAELSRIKAEDDHANIVINNQSIQIEQATLSANDLQLNNYPIKQWTKLLGTSINDEAHALTTGNDGAIYVSGFTRGNLDGQTYNGGERDVFITKYNPDGTKVWTKLLGTSGYDYPGALTTGNDGTIYVSGSTTGNLDGQTFSGGYWDAFITKYNPDGTKVWTKLLGTSGNDSTYALTTGNDGTIYVSGSTYGNLDGQTNSGESDAFITKYNPNGTKVWTKLLGTNGEETARALTTGNDGAIYVSGYTTGNLDSQTNSGYIDAFITKYNPDGTKVWTKLLGTNAYDSANDLTTGNDGAIYVSGSTYGNLDGQTNSGNGDAFITKYNPDGTKVWTRLLGTSGLDSANDLTTGNDGAIYVSGNLDGQTNSGYVDAFITKYNPDGTKVWTKLLGTSDNDYANSLTTGNDGTIYVSGFTYGNLDGQTNSGYGNSDVFITKYQDAPAVNITLAVSPASVLENGTTNLVYTFTRTGPTTNALTVNYGITGTANATDYTGATPGTGKTITFAAGSATAALTIDPTADTTIEANETVALTLATGTGYTVGTTAAVTGTITNDDFPSINLSPNSQTVVEGLTSPQNLSYTVSLSGSSTQTITVQYSTFNGTALASSDYTTTTGTLTFNPGVTSQTISIPILNDSLNEVNETFTVKLTSPTNAILGGTATVTTTITDTLSASTTTTLAANVENLLLTGTTAIYGTGNAGNNVITGNSAANTLNGKAGIDTFTGGIGTDTFVFQFGQSLVANSDRITDFAIGTDKIDLLTQNGLATNAPTAFTRAVDSSAANLTTVVNNVFIDANGAIAGNQALAINSAALVKVTTTGIAGTYLVINDSTAGFQANNDLLVNITGFTGTIPALGTVAVNSFFV